MFPESHYLRSDLNTNSFPCSRDLEMQFCQYPGFICFQVLNEFCFYKTDTFPKNACKKYIASMEKWKK